MKSLKKLTVLGAVFGMALAALGSQAALAVESGETSGGGDTCKKSVPVIKELMLKSVKAQGDRMYPEFAFATLEFFMKRATVEVVPQTFDETGQESDATSYPARKRIELSRARWCGQSEASKAGLLFHEYLVVMEIEKTGVYDVSSRFISIGDAEAQERLNKKWVCTVSGVPSSCFVYGCRPGQRGEGYFKVGTGKDPEAALLWALIPLEENNYTPCYRIAESNEKNRIYCAEAPTVANSCVNTMP